MIATESPSDLLRPGVSLMEVNLALAMLRLPLVHVVELRLELQESIKHSWRIPVMQIRAVASKFHNRIHQ